ncbi:uncharacterized protein A4U43_C08F7820 [Asparagus officinalis]|uniref:mechanosensitive ion channel protein 2, chloroplastic-like n=1 Tax=Asparagus officinalis TaxID=4686 RepID=UPI00098E3165|nr:mechanosensitive ion channel protein 2, chloroplastic-like [Asparagus officinalis]ONK59570.1 uncharacterized protein A4U43_C08F7820 [Asparagus officinalis]
MAVGVSLQLPPQEFGVIRNYGGRSKQFKSSEMRSWCHSHLPSFSLSSSRALRQDIWILHVSDRIYRPRQRASSRYNLFTCHCFVMPSFSDALPLLKNTALALSRSYNVLKEGTFLSGSYIVIKESPLVMRLAPAIGILAFAVWGLGPLIRHSRSLFFHRNDANWNKSKTHYVFTSYLQPLLLWTGATLVCRALDPVVLPSATSQTVKRRLLNFVQSLSTVLAFAYCLTSLIQQTQKFFMEKSSSDDTRNMGFQFAGKAVYSAVWIAAVSLFMELLGFSTQKWVTAGGLGTVLLTLAGREIFTNFLSSIMIHATRPFVPNEWIQAKIEGYEVSGIVEHVGWWSPTVIRGDDREAIHIPNHKFTVNVVRNLTQRTHWRIKTHLAISHLDVNKINNIVADMRKVLAKNPQIEQQRLHRRVFLENINPENQALLILISCFVKTSHFEEYLCVKEAVLLDLLRVISHHRARLATPIRTVQKVYSDSDMDNIPFSETIFTRGGRAVNRPLLLLEPPQRINGDNKAKVQTTPRPNEEQATKNTVASEPNPTTLTDATIQNDSEKQQQNKTKSVEKPQGSSSNSTSKPQVEYNEKPPVAETITKPLEVVVHPTVKTERPASSSSVPKTAFQENIVLNVALEGSKRTLPIEEGMGPDPSPLEANEMAASCSKNGPLPSDGKDNKAQMPPTEKGDQER